MTHVTRPGGGGGRKAPFFSIICGFLWQSQREKDGKWCRTRFCIEHSDGRIYRHHHLINISMADMMTTLINDNTGNENASTANHSFFLDRLDVLVELVRFTDSEFYSTVSGHDALLFFPFPFCHKFIYLEPISSYSACSEVQQPRWSDRQTYWVSISEDGNATVVSGC